jgi:hypothetical protein
MTKRLHRIIGVGLSDLHSGFTLGLTNPETSFIDPHTGEERQVLLTSYQQYLWDDVFMWGINQVKDLADTADIYIFGCGDLTHGPLSETTSSRMSDQLDAGFYALLPLIEISKHIKCLRWSIGTSMHVFGEGSSEIATIRRLQERYPKLDAKSVYHGCSNIGGFQIDHAHHGPYPGSRTWLLGNTARAYLKDQMIRDLDMGERPADLVLRGHYHTMVREWCGMWRNDIFYESNIVVLPPLCLLGDYGHKATRSTYRLSPGIVAFEIVDNKLLSIHPFIKNIDIRVTEDI